MGTIALLAAVYPAVWAALQPWSGLLSDRHGRRGPIMLGMTAQALGLVSIAAAGSVGGWLVGIAVLGAGTALVYPVLLAAAGDLAPPLARASSIGHYRFWRDLGFVFGALGAGALADHVGSRSGFAVLAGIAGLSALVVARPTLCRDLL